MHICEWMAQRKEKTAIFVWLWKLYEINFGLESIIYAPFQSTQPIMQHSNVQISISKRHHLQRLVSVSRNDCSCFLSNRSFFSFHWIDCFILFFAIEIPFTAERTAFIVERGKKGINWTLQSDYGVFELSVSCFSITYTNIIWPFSFICFTIHRICI